MGKPAHHSGSYHVRSRRLVAEARARDRAADLGVGSHVRCWRCGLTLAEHPPHRTGAQAIWTAGHTRDGDPAAPLAAEASTCNYTAGAEHGNRLRVAASRFVPRRAW